MPIDNSIALQAKAPTTSLSDMINIARGAQAYQQQAQSFPVEMQRLSQLAEKEKQINPQEIAQAEEATKQVQFGTKQKYQEAADRGLSALSQDPDILAGKDPMAITRKIMIVKNKLIDSGVPLEQAEIGAAHLISAAHQNPASVVDMIALARRNQIPASQQQANITGQQSIAGETPTGKPLVQTINPSTGQITVGTPQETSPQAMLPPTETKQSYAQMQEQRNSLANSAPDINKGISRINEATEVLDKINEGSLGEALAKLSSATGYFIPVGTDEAAAKAILAKDLAGITIEVNKATNGKFASSLEAAASSIANPNAPVSAIKASLEQIKPIMLHAQNMNNGLQKVIKNTNGDIQAERLFHNEMANAYDPKAILAIDAMKNGKLPEFLKNITAEERKKIKIKAEKYENLMNGNL